MTTLRPPTVPARKVHDRAVAWAKRWKQFHMIHKGPEDNNDLLSFVVARCGRNYMMASAMPPEKEVLLAMLKLTAMAAQPDLVMIVTEGYMLVPDDPEGRDGLVSLPVGALAEQFAMSDPEVREVLLVNTAGLDCQPMLTTCAFTIKDGFVLWDEDQFFEGLRGLIPDALDDILATPAPPTEPEESNPEFQEAMRKANGNRLHIAAGGIRQMFEGGMTNLEEGLAGIFADLPMFTCPVCAMHSYNVKDGVEGYCGKCHDWTRPRVDQ